MVQLCFAAEVGQITQVSAPHLYNEDNSAGLGVFLELVQVEVMGSMDLCYVASERRCSGQSPYDYPESFDLIIE